MANVTYAPSMGRTKLGRKRIDLTLPPELADALMEAAKKQNRDRSALMEEAGRDYLKKIGERPAKKKRGAK